MRIWDSVAGALVLIGQMKILLPFSQIWLCDFEFRQPDGEPPIPICLVAREYHTRRVLRLWEEELIDRDDPPYAVGEDSLFVAYYASAELGCHLSLGWPVPARILDLYVEFRRSTNGVPTTCGSGLLGALAHFGMDAIEVAEKDEMRQLAIRGGPYTDDERTALLEYCQSDVDALSRLLDGMLPQIDLTRALLRGRYMGAAARMERTGVPIDLPTLRKLSNHWTQIQERLIHAVNRDFGIYIPTGCNLNPKSRFGAAVLEEAQRLEIDPYLLGMAAKEVWEEERESHEEHETALRVARKSTGLNARTIAAWEDSGRDHSTYPGFDVTARELAAEQPALSLGAGYETGAGFDDTDYSARLWEMLRRGARPRRTKYDPEILEQAAERVAGSSRGTAGIPLSFSANRFAAWLVVSGIPWPRHASGALDLSDETFRQMARRYPAVAPIRELRHTLSQLRLNELAVGPDGRNRCLMSAFRSKTGRNQPSNSKFIFGPSCWLRALIRPEPGRTVAYIDWEQQEFGIAAALSHDKRMMDAYLSGDPYLAFAKQAGAAPVDATKATHSHIREQFKVCALAVQYGMGAQSLAQILGQPEIVGRDLLRLHRQTYLEFWKWSQGAVDHAMLHGYLDTVFGWRVHVGPNFNPRSLANFPVQANGAEMLRLACCLATEVSIRVCAPIHDALLVEASDHEAEEVVLATQVAMRQASEIVLSGFSLRSEAKVVRYPDRYMDPRGQQMWDVVVGILEDLEREEGVPWWDT